MAKVHVVEQGEHVPKIAARLGFDDVAKIWDDGDNAELKQKKRSPCVLHPQDHLSIPDLVPLEARLETGKRHVIVLKRPKVHLRVAFKNASDKPLAGFDVRLKTETKTFELTLDGDGKLDQEIPVESEQCTAVFSDGDILLLTPIEEPSGQRDRLNNLGYEAGTEGEGEGEGDHAPAEEGDEVDEATQLLRSAIEEFQCDHGIKVTGICDDGTKAKLVELHGV